MLNVSDIEQALQAMVNDFVSVFNDRDWDKVRSYYTDDAIMNVPEGYPLNGKEGKTFSLSCAFKIKKLS